MPSRTFRLRVVPERAADVYRIIDFDGRHTLHDVHRAIQRELCLDDNHCYSFFMSGRYWDRESRIAGPIPSFGPKPRDTAAPTVRALLFRLGLKPGSQFAYLFDYGDELRHSVEVISVTESPSPLSRPVLVDSSGAAPPQYARNDYEQDGDAAAREASREQDEQVDAPPELLPLLPLANELDRLLIAPDGAGRERERLEKVSSVAMELVAGLDGSRERARALEEAVGLDLTGLLLDLPFTFAREKLVDAAADLGKAAAFLDPENFLGDRALILAEAGRHAEARDQLEENLRTLGDDLWVRLKAGDAWLELGDAEQCETLYRSALESATGRRDRVDALARLCALLRSQGREGEVETLTAEERARNRPPPKVGRNDPCPCGSGKKHKKCCGKAA